MPGAIENSLHDPYSQNLLVEQFMEEALRFTERGSFKSKAERYVYARDYLLNKQMAMNVAAFKLDQMADEEHQELRDKRLKKAGLTNG